MPCERLTPSNRHPLRRFNGIMVSGLREIKWNMVKWLKGDIWWQTHPPGVDHSCHISRVSRSGLWVTRKGSSWFTTAASLREETLTSPTNMEELGIRLNSSSKENIEIVIHNVFNPGVKMDFVSEESQKPCCGGGGIESTSITTSTL